MSVDFKRKEYEDNIERWKMVRDISQARNLKEYLVTRNPHDKSQENVRRNNQIFKRAVFSEVTGYTINGFIGMLFKTWPKVDLPSDMQYAVKDITGSNISLYQFAQELCAELIKKGRVGVWVDFPPLDSDASREDIQSGRAVATANLFTAEQIINWRTRQDGAQTILDMVVLQADEEVIGADGFSIDTRPMRLELGLDSAGAYYVQKWIKSETEQAEWIPEEEPRYPRNGAGGAFNRIPFEFGGSQINNWRIDRAPMYSIAALNKAHFNNSAIYEDSVYQVGQAQPWMSGLDQSTLDLMAANNMYVGSGRLVGVPSGERFEFAQAQPNSMAKEAMDSKIDQMIGLGAMFIQPGSAVKTAAQAEGEQTVQHSVLSLIAENASELMVSVLNHMAAFMNSSPDAIEFVISSKLVNPRADANMLREMIAGFVQGAIPMDAYLRWLQQHQLEDGEKEVEDFSAQLSVGGSMPDLDDD